MELWRDIQGYEGLYQVSNYGRVRSLERVIMRSNGKSQPIGKKILRFATDKDGYLIASLRKGGIKRMKKVHRLVAEAFIPNPQNLPQVNHKDENKSNNNVDNLEWCTASYNINYGTRKEKVSSRERKEVFQYSLDGELVKIWVSIAECGNNGYSSGAVSQCCNNKYMQPNNNKYKDYRWSYTPL